MKSAAGRPPAHASKQTAIPLLRMTEISKAYPGVQALRNVSLDLHAAEVLAVLGENGAGKSTLMKVLAGAVRADSGGIEIEGTPVSFRDPSEARAAGIAVIYQEFSLIPTLTVPENLFLEREGTRHGFLQPREELRKTRQILERLGVSLPLDVPCRELTTAQQQLVEIARALANEVRILVMDEPTATLTGLEIGRLFEVVRELRANGIGILYVSHRLEEIFALADRVLFLRDGAPAGEEPIGALTRTSMIERMVGRTLEKEYPPRLSVPGDPVVLEVQNLSRGSSVRGVSFELHRGEILALTGLVGSGRTETVRLLFGADTPDSGTILRNGHAITISSPGDAIAAGIGLLPEDRKRQGLSLHHSLVDNFALPNLDRFHSLGFLNTPAIETAFKQAAEDLRMKYPATGAPAGALSGGNQQKVVLAKWLARRCEILIFDEPTRGVDVGAKFEIYSLMRQLVAGGCSILMISSEMPEVLGLADRILVMHDGRITGEIRDVSSATQEMLMQLAIA